MSTEVPSLKPSKDINEINKRLSDLRKSGVHLIGPGVQSLAKVETIPVSYEINWHCFLFDQDFKKGPDFYQDKRWEANNQVAFKREALLKMWMASGGRELGTHREDDGTEPYLVRWRFTAAVQDFSGNWVPAQGSREIDLREKSATAESMKTKPGQLSQQRQDIAQLAESKAQNRVIRKLLGISQSYTIEEIQKPFVLMRLVLVPDMTDPATKLFVLANAYGATAALFSNPDFTRMMLGPPSPTEAESQRQQQLPPAPAVPTTHALPAPDRTAMNPREERVLDFRSADPSQQIGILKDMMRSKGYGTDKLNRPIDQFSEQDRIDLFGHLLELADRPEPAFKL